MAIQRPLEIGFCTESLTKDPYNSALLDDQSPEKNLDALGLQGWSFVEIAPAAFNPHLLQMTSAARRALAQHAVDAGVPIKTMHWMMWGTNHLLTSPDARVREGGTEFLKQLAGAAADMNVPGGGITGGVFGSPPARKVEGAATDDHFHWFSDSIAGAMPAFDAAGVDFWMEFLAARETAFCNTPEEALRIAELIAHPRAQKIHFDIKAASALVPDVEGVCALMRKFRDQIGYVHFNDKFGSYPGFGSQRCEPGSGEVTDFRPIIRTMHECGLTRASVEMFCMFEGVPGYPAERPLEYARYSLQYLRACEREVSAA